MDFEQQILQAVKNSIMSQVKGLDFIKVDYQQRQPLPQEFINKVWASVEWDKVLLEVKSNLETRICNAIVGNMETEIKSDVKSLLGVDGVRQRLRLEVYPSLMKVLNEEKQ